MYIFRKYNGCEEEEVSNEDNNLVEEVPSNYDDGRLALNIESVMDQEEMTLEEQSDGERQIPLKESNMTTLSRNKIKQGRHINQPPKGVMPEEETLQSDVDFRFCCDFCGYRARQPNTLQVHVEMNHINLLFQCKICDFALKERYITRKHISKVHSIKHEDINDFLRTECGICQNTGKVDEITEHISQCHPEFTNFLHVTRRKKKKYAPINFKCIICSEDFSNLPRYRTSAIRNHVQSVHVKSLYKCDQCPYESKTLFAVHSHINSSHDFPRNLEADERKELTRLHVRHKCSLCGFEIANSEKDIMMDHMKVNHEGELLKKESPNYCNKCNFRSISRKMLKFHKKTTHPNTEKHQCPLCDFEADQRCNFLLHLHKHIGTTYLCNHCDFQSRKRLEFKKHYTTQHTNVFGEESFSIIDKATFKCVTCNIKTEGRNYHNHMIEKHKFPIVKQLLWRKDSISGEVKIHSKYKCSLCEHGTNFKANFVIHMEKHIGTVYFCNLCDYQSKIKHCFVSHIRNQHQEEYVDKQTVDHMTCKCTPCDIQITGRKYKSHMIQIHEFPLHDNEEKKTSTTKQDYFKTSKSSYSDKDHSNDLHKCPNCKYGSNSKFLFMLHLHKHLGTRYICNICQLEIKGRAEIKHHFRDQHKKEYTGKQNWMMDNITWKCEKCNLQISGREYKIHMINIHNFNIKDRRFSEANQTIIQNERKQFPHNCPQCQYGTKLLSNMREHMYTHMGTSFSCKLCETTSKRRGIILNHMMEKHKKEVRLDPNNWISKYVMCYCTSCAVSLSSGELDEHIVRVHAFPLKTKAPVSRINMKILQAPTIKPVTTMKTRSPKDIALMLKLAQLPIAVNRTN